MTRRQRILDNSNHYHADDYAAGFTKIIPPTKLTPKGRQNRRQYYVDHFMQLRRIWWLENQ